MTDIPAFYRRDDDRFVPTGIGVSPWNDRAQVGVAVAGLTAHVLDSVPTPVPMLTARLTIDLVGAVPMAPLGYRTRVLREGKRVQLVEIELHDDDQVWVRGAAVRLRTDASPAAEAPPSRAFPEPPDVFNRVSWAEVIRIEGDFGSVGPGAQWVRFPGTVVAGAPLAPLEAVAMIADFANGTGPLLPISEWTLANVDISLHISRLPRGPWLLIDARSESAGNGIGLASARIGDRDGMIAVTHQTMFLDRFKRG